MSGPIHLSFSSPETQDQFARALLWNGLAALTGGVLLVLVPASLNVLAAVLILAYGIVQVAVGARRPGFTLRQGSGWLLVVFGFVGLVVPAILSYLVIGFLLSVIILVAAASMRTGALAWGWFLLFLGFAAGGLILAFPYALNRIFGIFLIIFGAEQLVFSYRLRN